MSSQDEMQAATFRKALELFEAHPQFGCPYATGSLITYYFHGDTAEAKKDALMAALPDVEQWAPTRSHFETAYRGKTSTGIRVNLHVERS